MKNKIFLVITFLFTFISFGVNNVYAEASVSGNISFDTNSKKIIFTVSSNEHIGQIYGTLICNNIGQKDLTNIFTSNPPTSFSYSLDYSVSSGNYNCYVTGFRVGTLESAKDGVKNHSVSSKTLSLGSPSQSNSTPSPKPSNNSNKGTSQNSNSNKTSKSNNNYLKSFGVEGYNLSSEFNKDNGDYSVTVPYDTKEVKVIYEKEDDKASISGDEGVKSVSVGENKFTITVTAENGEQRNYTVNVIVEEKPIIIKKNNDEYSVVTKEEDLPKLDIEHDVITLNIKDTEVKAYRIDSIDYVLIALRDKNNDVKLYKFDSFKDDEKEPIYTLYQDINLSGIYLVLTEPKSIPSGYKKVSIKINGNNVTAYKKNKGFYLVYGLNTSNNKESFYSYDEGENTLQRYNIEELNDTLKENDNLKKFAFLLCIGLIAAFIIIIIICVKKCENKEAKELRKEEKKNKKLEIQNQKKETKKQRKEEKRLKKEAKKVEDKVEDDE